MFDDVKQFDVVKHKWRMAEGRPLRERFRRRTKCRFCIELRGAHAGAGGESSIPGDGRSGPYPPTLWAVMYHTIPRKKLEPSGGRELRFALFARRHPQQMADVPNAAPVACVLAGHGLFLLGCGWYGANISGWTAMHSLYAGAGGGAALGVCSLLTVGGTRKLYMIGVHVGLLGKLYMIGVHVGLLLQLAFSAVFGLQAWRSYGVPAKADRFPLFVVMCGGSVLALGLMRACKPKAKEKK